MKSAEGQSLASMAARLGRRLCVGRQTLATAESCTGGWIAKTVTDISGSSQWFKEGFVTYSNESKHERLGVPNSVLKKHGAVSEATARAMAAGALRRAGSDVAVAVTGIAGPGGGVGVPSMSRPNCGTFGATATPCGVRQFARRCSA
jgi:nicotinamide-nucleotide amidase